MYNTKHHSHNSEVFCSQRTTLFGEVEILDNNITIYNGDCLEIMNEVTDKSIDMILCDLPYGTTQNKWDTPIELNSLWRHYERIIKDNGCIALFAQAPFDKILAVSNLELFRYEWIVEKTRATGHLNANKMPLKAHENVLIFYKKQPVYNAQKTYGHPPVHNYTKHSDDGSNYGAVKIGISGGGSTSRYLRDVIKYKWDTRTNALHPTQKPVALLEYFIKTYTNENDVVLDSCMGSGSTGVACRNTQRHFIGIELDTKYYNIAKKILIK